MPGKLAVAFTTLLVGGALFRYYQTSAETFTPQATSYAPQSSRQESSLWRPRPNEHPLMPALRWADEGLPRLGQLQDYTATFISRERVDGVLGDTEYMILKVRHNPFSIYVRFLAPAAMNGREAIYVKGENDGNVLVHLSGSSSILGTIRLKPDSVLAMAGRRYPVTEIGALNLVRRLADVARSDIQYEECEVQFVRNAMINDRRCTCLQVVHPVRRPHFRYHIARIFVDEQLDIPIRFECYDWPKAPGGPPELLEEYTYVNVQLNNGFTDEDFSPQNPKYQF